MTLPTPRRSQARGFSLPELIIVMAVIAILATIAMPNFVGVREKAYDASAVSSGRNAKTVMHIYHEFKHTYPDNLEALLGYEDSLTDDAEVTFVFGVCDTSGYTFTVGHARSKNVLVLTD